METVFIECVGALDAHKAQIRCSRLGSRTPRARVSRSWRSSRRPSQGLMALRDWLAAYRVTHVAMEATGVYWQPGVGASWRTISS